jgi:hypothetical protein
MNPRMEKAETGGTEVGDKRRSSRPCTASMHNIHSVDELIGSERRIRKVNSDAVLPISKV